MIGNAFHKSRHAPKDLVRRLFPLSLRQWAHHQLWLHIQCQPLGWIINACKPQIGYEHGTPKYTRAQCNMNRSVGRHMRMSFLCPEPILAFNVLHSALVGTIVHNISDIVAIIASCP